MRKFLFAVLASSLALTPATAALKVGSKAPDFTTTGAVGGKEFRIHLAEQLKKGPVVLISSPRRSRRGALPRRMPSAKRSTISRRPGRK